ncbi:RNA polymerase subunit sigma-24 [Dyadobacter luteus]|jgi:RNA polymerase sigma factor (sigma-70 family)|uniref:RNA polymerase subunit sigma-24 n=1 Tax=Dyadobacter luteus TaxID=2259619 RepID=A0A3D8Y9D8_9BACT|nr:RNA polymerase sigma factor [Dyadobacter luteus]REA59938.1 RNA polymerase subunit sigma-24 [Dyadobacter luteus]
MAVRTSKNDYARHNFTDEELVKLFVETQENRYFEKLYERYSEKVYHKCLSFVKDSAKAEDLTHDIFLKLIFKLGTFKEDAKFSTWLYSITYNHCMDQLRSNKKRGEVLQEDPIEVPDDVDLNNLFDGEDIEIKNLKTALDQLTVEEKGVLFMKYMDDLSIRDIAGIFNVTESAIKMRLLRSREKLRKKYLETIIFLGILAAKMVELVWDIL